MKLIKQYPTCLLIILIATLFCQNTMAQKNRNKKKAKQEVVQEEEENLDIWTETPICKVMIVDSIVVDKKELVQQIPLPGHLGKIFIDTETGNYIYENDFADMRYITQTDTSGYHNIYRQILLAEKWGAPELIQINGDKYDYINPYSCGFARITKNGKVGFLDMNYKEAIPPKFNHAYPFKDGLALVDKSYYIDTFGKKAEKLVDEIVRSGKCLELPNYMKDVFPGYECISLYPGDICEQLEEKEDQKKNKK